MGLHVCAGISSLAFVCAKGGGGGGEGGGGEEGPSKTSISPLYYVPACVSSLMQSPCPPHVSTHARANSRTPARTQWSRVFLLSTKKKKMLLQPNRDFFSSKLIYLISRFTSPFQRTPPSPFFFFFFSGNRAQVQLIPNRLLSPREQASSLRNRSRCCLNKCRELAQEKY